MSQPQAIESIEPGNFGALDAALRAQLSPEDLDEPGTEDDTTGQAGEGNDGGAQPPAAAPAAAPAPAPSSSATATEEPTGILLKDGKRVLPYGVLEQERARAAAERQGREAAEARAAELEQQLKDLQAGGASASEKKDAIAAVFDERELEDLAETMPAVKKLHDAFIALQQQTVAAAPAAAPAAKPVAAGGEDAALQEQQRQIDEALAGTTLLKTWVGGALFQEAAAVDKQLANEDAWKGKSFAERFAEVERRVATRYGIPIPSPTKQPGPSKGAETQELGVQTLSDLGGAPPVPEADAFNHLSSRELRGRFDKMSSDQIAEVLRRAG